MSKHKSLDIVKASGHHDSFDISKLKKSLIRSGASGPQVDEVIGKVKGILYPGISTRKIYKAAFKLLREKSRPLAARYKLKSAIMELGPSGFPFEKFIAEILRSQGYTTQTGVMVTGKCVKHEIDVIAEQDNEYFMIECKYHNHPGTICDVKVPLYIYSRFKDVEASWLQLPGHQLKLHQGWVVTNTRFSVDAIQYGTCMGLYLLGWDYPVKGGLNQQIERSGLYPVTCLTTLSKSEKQNLLAGNIVLCREICDRPDLLKDAGVSDARIKIVLDESMELCREVNRNDSKL
jgi:hypothetical protein